MQNPTMKVVEIRLLGIPVSRSKKAWNLAEVKGSYERVLREPWVPGMCKGL
jgi:hypothetical protein